MQALLACPWTRRRGNRRCHYSSVFVARIHLGCQRSDPDGGARPTEPGRRTVRGRQGHRRLSAWALLRLGMLVMPPALMLAIAGAFARAKTMPPVERIGGFQRIYIDLYP